MEINLTIEQRTELELFYKQGNNHVLHQRCQIISLKFAKRKILDICKIVGVESQNQINKWIKLHKNKYSNLGIKCLRNVAGQGRRAIFDPKSEAELTQKVVGSERQKLKNAKVILEKELNKTLKNFLGDPIWYSMAR